jgi:hypothetical protein
MFDEDEVGVFLSNHPLYTWMNTLFTSIRITATSSVSTVYRAEFDLADMLGNIDRFQDFVSLHVAVSSTFRRIQVVCGYVHQPGLLPNVNSS